MTSLMEKTGEKTETQQATGKSKPPAERPRLRC